MKREINKRANFRKIEKFSRIINVIKGITRTDENEIRTSVKISKKRIKTSSFRNHCLISGRAHSIYSHYKLSRNEMRRFAHRGLLYGLMKASW